WAPGEASRLPGIGNTSTCGGSDAPPHAHRTSPASADARRAGPNLLVGSMYRLLFNLALRRVEPERAHGLAKRSLRIMRSNPPARAVVRRIVGDAPRSIGITALGLTFPSPLG